MSNTENKENQSDQVVSVNPEVVVENIKETSIWLRLVLVIIFLFVFTFTDIILWLIAGVQFLFTIFTKKPNENLCFPQGGFEPTTLGSKDRRYTTELKIQHCKIG